MITLGEAWDRYEATKRQLNLMERIGWKHWDDLPWEGAIGKDERVRTVESRDIIADTELSLEHLNDFAVLILFSAFESIIREQARSDLGSAQTVLCIRSSRILDEAIQDVGHGSISRVLDVYKGYELNIVEEINQVRRYRNWVAHGRRGESPSSVDPKTAYDRLKRFLDRFAPSNSDEP